MLKVQSAGVRRSGIMAVSVPAPEEILENVRKYGQSPYTVAVIHGGPGAQGDMAPVAIELSRSMGVIEPLQRADSIEALIEELKNDLSYNAELPVILIGHSWGAWLSMLFTATHPTMVKKCVIIGCPPVRQEFATLIMKNRLSRLDPEGQIKFTQLIRQMKDHTALKGLLKRTDAFDPIEEEDGSEPVHKGSFEKLWGEAEEMRKSGALEERFKTIVCPVIAIHGAADPHPAEGVKLLSSNLPSFRFIPLEKCGHTPWKERQASVVFFRVLKDELNRSQV